MFFTMLFLFLCLCMTWNQDWQSSFKRGTENFHLRTMEIKRESRLNDIWKTENIDMKLYTFSRNILTNHIQRRLIFCTWYLFKKSTNKTIVCTLLVRDDFLISFFLETDRNDSKGRSSWKSNTYSLTLYESVDKISIHTYTKSSSINAKNFSNAQFTLKYLKFWIMKYTKQLLKLFRTITIQFLNPKKTHGHDGISIKMWKLNFLLS